ncbi:MAG TPA: hypothetical protein VFN41_15040 [Candidatus Limnocylindrales bacterium]|nr:hypothetical protein [Candidatus Limnocylindrales bacterium]
MGDTERHLAIWRAAGVIDDATAARIAAWDAQQLGAEPSSSRPSFAAIFGPGISIGEMFAYIGAAFLLAATDVFLGRTSIGPEGDITLAVGSAIQAVVLFAIGLSLIRGDARRQRAGGVAFLVATTHAGVAAWFTTQAVGIEAVVGAVLAGAVAVLFAAAARRLHPALTTQASLLASATYLSFSLLMWIQQSVFGTQTGSSVPAATEQQQLLMTIGSAAWWLVTGVVLGLMGLYESRREGTVPGAEYRAALTRLWAGIVAIAGFCSAVTRSAPLPDGSYGRVLEPWVAQVAILIVSAVLVERAFRRSSAAFVVAGAIGMIVALTDFNFSYLSDRTEVGLLVEGIILLAVGFTADRIRRRLGRATDGSDAGAAPPSPPPIDQPLGAAAPGE